MTLFLKSLLHVFSCYKEFALLLGLCCLCECLGRQLSILLWRLILKNRASFVLLLKICILFRSKHVVVLVWRGLQLGRLLITLTFSLKKKIKLWLAVRCQVPLRPSEHQETEPHLSNAHPWPRGMENLGVIFRKCFLLADSCVRTGSFTAHGSGRHPSLVPGPRAAPLVPSFSPLPSDVGERGLGSSKAGGCICAKYQG